MNSRNRLWTTLLVVIASLSGLSLVAAQTATPTAAPPIPITLKNAAQLKELAQLKGHTSPVFTLAFSPNSKSLVSGGSGDDHTAIVWDVPAASQRAVLKGHADQIIAVGFNSDGSQILTASYDATIRTWDTASGVALDTLDTSSVADTLSVANLDAAFTHDGSQLVYGTQAGEGAYLFDLKTKTQVDIADQFPDLIGNILYIALTPDGKTVLAVDPTGIIHLLDVATHAQTARLIPTDSTSYGGTIALTHDGKMLAIPNFDTAAIRLWNLDTRTPGALLASTTMKAADLPTIGSLAFNPDGSLLAAASSDHTIRLWDVKAAKEIAALSTGAEDVGIVIWSRDDSLLAFADLKGVIHLWNIP